MPNKFKTPCIFITGMIRQGNSLLISYGAADERAGVARLDYRALVAHVRRFDAQGRPWGPGGIPGAGAPQQGPSGAPGVPGGRMISWGEILGEPAYGESRYGGNILGRVLSSRQDIFGDGFAAIANIHFRVGADFSVEYGSFAPGKVTELSGESTGVIITLPEAYARFLKARPLALECHRQFSILAPIPGPGRWPEPRPGRLPRRDPAPGG